MITVNVNKDSVGFQTAYVSVVDALTNTGLSSYMLKRQVVSTGGYIYIGLAGPGSLTSMPVWFISRIDSNGNQLHANGNTNFNNIFDDYISITYL